MSAEIYMALANIIFLVGTSFLFIKVIKNRRCLKDFDRIGAFLTFTGMCFSAAALFELKMWISILFSIPTVLFWFFVFIYSFKSN